MNKAQIEKSSKEISKKLDGAIIDSQKALDKSIKKLEKKIISLSAELKTDRGKLISLKTNFVQLKKLHKEIVILFEREYNKIIKRQVKDLDKIVDIVLQEFNNIEIAAKLTSLDKDIITVLKQNTYDQFVQFGVKAQERIAQAMYDAVIAQSEFSELVLTFSGIMVGGKDALGRSMSAYAKLYANDAIMSFHRSVHLMKADAAGLNYFLYTGTAMTTTRDFCRARIGKVFSREEIDSWNSMSWSGKSGNVWTCLGGHNCRHHLRALKKEWISESQKG